MIANNTNKSFVSTDGSKPSIAFLEALIATINKGIITGKLSTGISKFPFPDLEAMDDNNVKVDENPIAPKDITKTKYPKLCTGKPKKIL